MIIIKIDCCGRPQMLCSLSIWTSSDAMQAKGLKYPEKFQCHTTIWVPLDGQHKTVNYDSFATAILSRNHKEIDIAESISVSIKVLI